MLRDSGNRVGFAISLKQMEWRGSLWIASTLFVVLGTRLTVAQPPAPASPLAAYTEAPAGSTQEINPSSATGPDGISADLPAGTVTLYRIHLDSAKAVEITFQQEAGDIGGLLTNAGSTALPAASIRRSEAGKSSRLYFTITANESTDWQIHLRCLAKTAPCRYTIRHAAMHDLSVDDAKMANAEEMLAQADALRRKPDPDSKAASLAAYDRAIAAFRELDNQRVINLGLYGKGRANLELRKFTEARDALQQAASLSLAPEDSPFIAAAWKALGYSQAYLGDLEAAIAAYQHAAPYYQSDGDQLNQEILTENMARAHRALGENNQALQDLTEALAQARALHDEHGIAASLEELGNIQLALGDLQDSLDAYREALTALEAAPNQVIEAHVLNGMGNVYALFADPEQAHASFDQSLSLWHQLKDPMGAAYALDGLGFLSDTQHDPTEAIRHYQDALDSIHGLNLDRETAVILEEQGEAYLSAGLTAKAVEAFNRSMAIATRLHLRTVEADCLRSLGEAAAARPDGKSARQYFGQAQEIYTAVADRQKQALLLADEARLSRSAGDLDKARQQIEQALSLVESSRKSIRNLDNRSGYFSEQHDYYDFYISLLMQLGHLHPDANYAALALEASERARARALLDTLRESGVKLHAASSSQSSPAPLDALLLRERSIADAIDAQIARLGDAQENALPASAIAPIQQRLADLGRQEDQLRASIRQQDPAYAAITQTQTLSAASIQQSLLDGDTLLLEYWLGSEHSYLWAVTTSRIAAYQMPPRSRLEDAARALNQSWTARNRNLPGETIAARGRRIRLADLLATRQSATLAAQLLAPVSALLHEHSRIVICAEGALLSLPFAALPDPASHRPLIVSHEVVNLPSASVLPQLRNNRRGSRAPRLALFADPVFSTTDPRITLPHPAEKVFAYHTPSKSSDLIDLGRSAIDAGVPEFARLPYSHLEAEQISRLLPTGEVWESLGFDANRAAVRSADWSNYTILHFSTHAVLDSIHPELSGIVLSTVSPDGQPEDGFLRVRDIYDLHIPVDLVVLSGCRTALGKEVRGEGLIGLSRAFAYAGSQRVVATLWDVNDRATASIMSGFYGDLVHRGLTPAAALADAQRKMAVDPRWSAPYFWAPFIMEGDWQQSPQVAENHR